VAGKARVLLIYPGSRSSVATVPIGLLHVAQALLKINIEVSFLHMVTDDISAIKLEKYLFVGISMLTGKMITNGLRAAQMVKDFDPHIPVVLGGIHPSMLPEESLRNKLVDVVVIGEGEETVKELAACLMNGQDLSKVKGIAYKDGKGEIFVNPAREFLDMEQLDYALPYELLGKSFYAPTSLPVHTSRGCPYRCSFCYSNGMNKRKYRYKSAQRVVAEIEYLINKYHIYNFDLGSEDEFFINYNRAVEIFETVAKKGLKIRWSTFCRFDTFDSAYTKLGDYFPRLLKESGCHFISFGAESGSQRLLDEVIKKDIKVEQIIKTVEVLKNNGLAHRVTFMNCLPTETLDDINASFDVIDRISNNNPLILIGLFNLTPYPGTEMIERLKNEYNYRPPVSLEEWGNYNAPIALKNITWVPAQYAKMCYNMAQVNAGIFNQDFKSYKKYREFIYNIGVTSLLGYHNYVISKIERWRYKKRFFKWMIETFLANKLMELYKSVRNFLVNNVLKKYFPKSIFISLKKWFGVKDWENKYK
jgi:radical SAM superfamily enzyme YgiQ (UPF0313 family)